MVVLADTAIDLTLVYEYRISQKHLPPGLCLHFD
jgi:hypothetical protein